MDETTSINTVRGLLAEVTGLTGLAAAIAPDAPLATAGVDSGDIIRLVLRVEEDYGIAVDTDDLDTLNTVGGFARLVRAHAAPGEDAGACG